MNRPCLRPLLAVWLAGIGLAAGPVGAEAPPVYRLVAARHGLSADGLYALARRASGRPSPYAPVPTPWPWTVRACAGTRCAIAYPETREAMATVLAAGQRAGLTLYVGPLALRWDPDRLPLRAATQPHVTLQEAARQLALALRATPRGAPAVATARRPGSSARARWGALIDRVAAEENLPAALVHAVVVAESGYDPQAVSPQGAVGLMQLMPATAERFGVPRAARTDPARNLRAGVRYLGWLLNTFHGDLELALAGYNAGEGAVQKYGNQVPPYRETQQYVRRVINHLARPAGGPAS